MTAGTPTGPRSFLDRRIASDGGRVHRLKAKDSTGRWAYYFVFVPPAHERAFRTALASGEGLDLERHGHVIASNYGEEPSDATRRLLRDRYGFEV